MNKNIQKFKKYIKTRHIDIIEPIMEDKTANQNNFGCNTTDGSPVFTETDLEFAKTSIRFANVQNSF